MSQAPADWTEVLPDGGVRTGVGGGGELWFDNKPARRSPKRVFIW